MSGSMIVIYILILESNIFIIFHVVALDGIVIDLEKWYVHYQNCIFLLFICLMTRQYSAIFFNPLVKHNNFLMHFISLNSCGDSSHRIGQWKAKVLLNSQNNCFLSEMAFTIKSCVVVLNSVSI